MKTQIVLALSIMVIIFIITGCEKTTGIENTTQNIPDYSVGCISSLTDSYILSQIWMYYGYF